MPSTIPFWVAFVCTVLLLVVSLVTGFTARRRVHLWVGPMTIVSLAIAIILTEELASNYDLPDAELAIHLPIAKAGGLLAIPVVLTGLWLWKQPRARLWHRVAVIVWLVSVLAATGTGLWVFGLGEPKVG